MTGLRLTADAAPGAIEPNVARRKGFHLWNQDMHRTFGAAEYGDPNEPLRPIRLVGARNGYYSGLVVAGSDAPLAGLEAKAEELKGPGVIPAANVRVRYARLSNRQGNNPPTFIALDDAPPSDAPAVQPVWVTVCVPKQAAAGSYRGTLRILAAGAETVSVPVELEVVNWTLPDATAFRTFVSIYQSPDSIALQYKVDQWSEEHWNLMAKSAEMLGYLGNKLAVVPLIARTEFGNDESMVAWIKKADGSYDYDFAVFDR